LVRTLRTSLAYRSKSVVEYETPALAEGLVTQSRLVANADTIKGVAILSGTGEPDLLVLSVRLPNDLKILVPANIHGVEEGSGDR
jgi:hypothetical protein